MTGSLAAQRSRSLARWIAAALVLLAPAVAVFAPGLSYPFLDLDDVHHIVRNPAIRDLSWHGIRFLFLEDTRDLRYFPLTYLSLAVDYRLFGLQPFYFHLTNLVLHLANTLLVAALVLAVFRDRLTAFLTALLFSVHPLQVESVAWVISRKNVLFLFFFLLSALAYWASVHGPRLRRAVAAAGLGVSALLYLLACLSKTAAITLPLVLVLIDHAIDPASGREPFAFLRRSLPTKLGHLGVAALVVALSKRASTPNPFRTAYGFSAGEWLAIVGHNFAFYVEKTLAPLQLGVFYPLPAPGALPPQFPVLAGLALGLGAILAWSAWRGWRIVFFGLAWYVVTISPMAAFAALFSDLPLLAADRYVYQSSIGLLLLPAAGFAALWRRRPALRAAASVLGASALVALCLLSAAHRSAFRSTIALYEELQVHHPTDEFSYRLALEYAGAGRMDDAFRMLAAAERAPSKVFFMNFLYYRLELSDLYRRKGDYASAADQLEAGIASTPNAFEPFDGRTPLAYLALADLRERAGDAPRAAAARSAAARAKPDPEHGFEVAWMRASPAEAKRLLEARVAADPNDGMAWFHLGLRAHLAGDEKTAREQLERAGRLGYTP